jgi:hypothetical protein
MKSLSESAFMIVSVLFTTGDLLMITLRHLNLASSALAVSVLLSACGGGSSAPTAASQTISFTPAGTGSVGTPITLSATASSGLAVAFSTSTTSVCTVSGTTLTLLSAGICTVNADQTGNSAFTAATQVSRQIVVSLPAVVFASGFGDGTLANGGTWANYAGWGQFSPSTVNSDHAGFGGGGWQESPQLIEGGYVYFGLTTSYQITGGYAGLYMKPTNPVTLNGQTNLSIPLAIGTEWANQSNNKSLDVVLQTPNSANTCFNKVKATVSTVANSLAVINIPLSQFTAVQDGDCNQTAAQTLAGPIAEVHVQAVAPNFNTTVLNSNSKYATGFTIGSPVKFE